MSQDFENGSKIDSERHSTTLLSATRPGKKSRFGLDKRYWLLTLLMAVSLLNVVDRFVVAVVLEPIRHEFGLTDSQLGLVGSLAHSIALSIFALPVGWMIDRYNRVKFLSLLLGLWSVLTMVGGLATSYMTLLLSRVVVGAAESGGTTGALSLVTSVFPTRQRSSVIGLIYASAAVGMGLVFVVGGYIAQEFGWRAVFFIAGGPGLVIALLLYFTVKEPARTDPDGEAGEARRLTAREVLLLFKNPPLLYTIGALTVASMTLSSVWVWVAPVLIRQHGLSITEAGLIVGISAGGAKALSTAISGFIADRASGGRVERLWIVPAIALTLSVPVTLFMTNTSSAWLASGLAIALGLFLGTHNGPSFAIISSIVPADTRGRVIAVAQLSLNLIGIGMGPMATGVISDLMGGGNAIGAALAGIVSLNLVAALLFWLGGRALARRSQAAQPAE